VSNVYSKKLFTWDHLSPSFSGPFAVPAGKVWVVLNIAGTVSNVGNPFAEILVVGPSGVSVLDLFLGPFGGRSFNWHGRVTCDPLDAWTVSSAGTFSETMGVASGYELTLP
jgi:hypothetical protein